MPRRAKLLSALTLGFAASTAHPPAQASNAAPPAVVAAEAVLWDQPLRLLSEAEKALDAASQRNDPAARLDAAMRLGLAAEELERGAPARRATAIGLPLALALNDRDRVCLLRGAEAYVLQTDNRNEGWCQARLLARRARLFQGRGRNAEELADTLEALRRFEDAKDGPWIASGLSALAWNYSRDRGNERSMARAIEHGEAAVKQLKPAQERSVAAVVYHNVAGVYTAAGRLSDARDAIAQALVYEQGVGDPTGLGYIARTQASIEMQAGRPERALPALDMAKKAFEAQGIEDMTFDISTRRAVVLAQLQQRDEALRELKASAALAERQHTAVDDVTYQQAALDVYRQLKDTERALAASEALRAAQRRQTKEENLKLTGELQERYESERKEAENRQLRELQHVSQRQTLLLCVTLLLALVLLALMCVLFVQQRKQRRRFAQLAECDEQTGLPNRRAMLQIAREALANRRVPNQTTRIAMLDIDHFKSVNDRYGRDVGDEALRGFARACRDALRGQDHLGRFGGEEFLLLMPASDDNGVQIVFDRLRERLRETPIAGMPEDSRLSFSMGCAHLTGEPSIEAAIQRADEALYRAKRGGRDRLELAAPPAQPAPSEPQVLAAR